MRIETDILILGGGISGLLAADFLSQKGMKAVILEKDSEVGGLARTFNFRGFRFDIGGHGLFFKNKENISYLQRIFENNDLFILKRKSKVLFENKYIDFPPNFFSVLKLNRKHVFGILSDMLRLNKSQQKDNFEDWIKSNYGNSLYHIYFKEYTKKVWGIECSRLSSNWADKRIGRNNLFILFKNIITNNNYCKQNSRIFYYPKLGIGTLPNLLAKRITNNGCKIFTDVQIQRLSLNNSNINSINFIWGGHQFYISFKKVISTVPIVELLRMFPYQIVSHLDGVIQDIRYRNLIIVCLIINKQLITNWHWAYFPSKEIIFSRIHEPKFWSKDMATPNQTLLCMEIFCNYDNCWNMPKEYFISKTENSLINANLIKASEKIIDAAVYKIEYAYPLQYKGFEIALNKTNEFLRHIKNLFLIGRNGTHSYFDIEECLDNVKVQFDSLLKN